MAAYPSSTYTKVTVAVGDPFDDGSPTDGTVRENALQDEVVAVEADLRAAAATGSGFANIAAAFTALWSAITSGLSRSNHTGTQTLSTISDAGTAAALNVPASGDATSGQVVKGNDSRLSDARTPTSHNHAGSEITSGTVAFARLPTGTSSSQVAIGDHTHAAAGTVTVVDESTTLTTAVTKLTFAGAGVTATEPVADEITVTIAGGGSTDYTALARTFAPLARVR